jgi:YidC/Oxa1 family membrane protein insertase
MSTIFTAVFYQPILNLLLVLYNTVAFQDLGLAIIILTIAIKMILWPFNQKAIKSQKALQELQPKLEEIKKKHADDKAALSQATIDLYRENKTNPFSSCLTMLVQLPVLIAVYQVFRDGVSNKLDYVYSFINKPEHLNTLAFGFLNLAAPNVILAVLAGLAQFWQAKTMVSRKQPNVKGAEDENMMAIMNKQMLYFMPAVTVFIGVTMPGGLTFYWLVMTLISAWQQHLIFKKNQEKIIEGEIVK